MLPDDPLLFKGLHLLFHLAYFSLKVYWQLIELDRLIHQLLLLEHLFNPFFKDFILSFEGLFLEQ